MSHIAKHSRRVLETTIDPDVILQRAIDRGRLPARRFRVEGSRFGNSRLLNGHDADKTRAQYGGQIVELITYETFLTAQAKDLPACARAGCLALAGKCCMNKKGTEARAPHSCRLPGGKVTAADAAAFLGPCDVPGCAGTTTGQPCTTPRGKARRPHKSRLPTEPGALL